MTSAKTVYNFCSGPAMLPETVMKQAQAEFLDYQSKGISIMEMSHRSDEFQAILLSAKARLRELMAIPENYQILLMQGGASLQFSCIPLNLTGSDPALYLDSGYWAKKALTEAQKYGSVEVLSVLEEHPEKRLLDVSVTESEHYSYIHYTPNETIDGLEFHHVPSINKGPLVADMSSCILSRPIEVDRFGLLYAGAQKNIGPAGLAVVIIREDLLSRADKTKLPRLLHYQTVLSEGSMANTPPTFAIYLANLVFGWLQEQGGVLEMERLNKQKSQLLYQALDQSVLFNNAVATDSRSRMNVPFSIDRNLETHFLEQAANHGLLNLVGHRTAGGCRASIYNAMPKEGVEKLAEFIKYFESQYV